jgi:hypothetical protein
LPVRQARRSVISGVPAGAEEHRPLTLEDVERIWEEAIWPKLPQFETMTQRWGEDEVLIGSSPLLF